MGRMIVLRFLGMYDKNTVSITGDDYKTLLFVDG